jgi:hypothetical protein
MTVDDETMDLEGEDMDVRKASVRLRRAGSAQSRRSIVAASELLGGMAGASAEAFRSLNAALSPEAVTRSGLGASVYVGIREGNVRFLQELSRASRRVFDALRPPGPDEPAGDEVAGAAVAERIDYERLAALVAAEMSKRQPGPD